MKLLQNKWITYSLLLLIYSLVFFVYSGQSPWEFSDTLAGEINGDMSQFLWSAYHFEEWVHGNQDFFYTDLLYTPYGTSLQYHTYSHLMAATSYIVGNSFLGINLIIWLHYILSGLGAYLLARFFKLTWMWAFLVGFIFAFIPYKFSHYAGHYNLQQTAVIPYFILVFFKTFPLDSKERFFSKIKLSNILLLALLSMLSLLSSYIYSAFLLFFGIGYIIYYGLYSLFPAKSKRYVFVLILCIIISIAIPYLRNLGLEDHGGFWWRDDMGKFLTPNWNNHLYHWATPFLYSNYEYLGLKHNDCFMGFALPLWFLVVSVLYFFRKKKNNLFPIIGFFSLFFFMLTSPEILIFKINIGYFPTALYHLIPGINNARIPERFILMFALFFPIYIFSVTQILVDKKKLLNKLLPFILLAIICIEFNQNEIYTSKKSDFPKWVITLKNLPKGSVLPLPTGLNDGTKADGDFHANHLYYQTLHRHKLVGGYVSRMTKVLRDKHFDNPVFNLVLRYIMQKDNPPTDKLSPETIDQFIKESNLRYILIPNHEKRYIQFVKNNFEHRIQSQSESDGALIYILN